MKHTPGPWYKANNANKSQGLIIDENTGKNIAVSYDPKDADIIAAAPLLLDFVIQYLYSEHGICADHHEAAPYQPEELKALAIAAIAKAEGTDNG